MNIVAAYTLLTPVYDFFRPLWAKWVMGRAEDYLEQEVLPGRLTPETRILDLGCGTGVNQERLRRLKLPYASYTGLDLTPAMLARAQAKLDGHDPAAYCQGDVRHLPYPDQCFDMVLSTWVLSHLTPPQKVFDEARRVLKCEGILIFFLWSRPPFPMGLIAGLLAPLFLVHFAEPSDLQRSLGREAVVRRYAGGWGMSIMLGPSISGPN